MFPSAVARVSSLLLVAAALSSASASESAANAALLKQPVREQKQILQEVVGEGCRAVRVFFNGVGRTGIAKGLAFWSVECSNGRRYMVAITPNVDDTRVMRCSELKVLGIGSCFTKFRD